MEVFSLEDKDCNELFVTQSSPQKILELKMQAILISRMMDLTFYHKSFFKCVRMILLVLNNSDDEFQDIISSR